MVFCNKFVYYITVMVFCNKFVYYITVMVFCNKFVYYITVMVFSLFLVGSHLKDNYSSIYICLT